MKKTKYLIKKIPKKHKGFEIIGAVAVDEHNALVLGKQTVGSSNAYVIWEYCDLFKEKFGSGRYFNHGQLKDAYENLSQRLSNSV